MENELFNFISQYVTLTKEEKEAVISLNIFRSFTKGEVLLKEGQYSQKGYFVLKGILRSYYLIEGEEKTTAFYTEMNVLTPNCVLTKQPAAHYVDCAEDALVTVSTPSMEEEVFQKFPKFETLCRILSEELLVQNQSSFDEFKTSSPEQRYLNLQENRPDLLQRVPQYQLASYLGIKPQSLSRLRTRIAQKKV